MTSLFLFFMRLVQLYVDKIFVQRTELWLIFKNVSFNGAFTKILPSTTLYFVSRSHSYLPSEIYTLYI